MSHQFDEYMMDKFEVNGSLYSLVEPSNFEELMKAYEIKQLLSLECSGLMHDDESAEAWISLLQEQEEYIDAYIKELGDFDNTILINNIVYLTRRYNMRLGDLEAALGISAGYISRTAKTDSKKKLSIDIVWKIAVFFEIDIKYLIETDLNVPDTNTELVNKFLDKLTEKTQKNEIEWVPNGGVLRFLDNKFYDMGLITNEDDISVYHPNHLNQQLKWVLYDDIFSCRDIDSKNELVVIPFLWEGKDEVYFDFIFTWEADYTKTSKQHHWEKAFYSEDDRYGTIREHAAVLYEVIQKQDCDAKVSKTARKIMTSFLK